MLIDVPFDAHSILFRVQSFFCDRGAPSSYRLSFEIAAHSGAIKLGKGEHLLRSGGTAGDSLVGFDGIFERFFGQHKNSDEERPFMGRLNQSTTKSSGL
jgi:hypothetical protein